MPAITKTMGAIHFEDLEPHRFEDLVRNLIYDFKNWQTIEATGRTGKDEGFDIRAWEKAETTEETIENDDTEIEDSEIISKEGNLWMIQGKREKEIGPKRVKEIIEENVDAKNPPYGYILAASADFSKESYDVFRDLLRKKGVSEFHLWGKAALEDFLLMPKNDHILFTFFGFSLLAKKRARKTEIRASILTKNKFIKLIDNYSSPEKKFILIRDINDKRYPYKGEYKDFEKNPRWREQRVAEFHPLGIIFNIREFYAYVDTEKKEFDFVKEDLIMRHSEREENKQKFESKDLIRDFWEHLPRKNQWYMLVNGIIKFEDMIYIDEKGDNWNPFPHIFCEYKYEGSPFRGIWEDFKREYEYIYRMQDEGYKRINIFPKKFSTKPQNKIITDKKIKMGKDSDYLVRNGNIQNYYSVDGKLDFLKQRDKIEVEFETDIYQKEEYFTGLEIMYKYQIKAGEYFKDSGYLKSNVEQCVGRPLTDTDILTVFEVKPVAKYEFAQEIKDEK